VARNGEWALWVQQCAQERRTRRDGKALRLCRHGLRDVVVGRARPNASRRIAAEVIDSRPRGFLCRGVTDLEFRFTSDQSRVSQRTTGYDESAAIGPVTQPCTTARRHRSANTTRRLRETVTSATATGRGELLAEARTMAPNFLCWL
jgi:hypothetical protein